MTAQTEVIIGLDVGTTAVKGGRLWRQRRAGRACHRPPRVSIGLAVSAYAQLRASVRALIDDYGEVATMFASSLSPTR
jgi:hypothetical protein